MSSLLPGGVYVVSQPEHTRCQRPVMRYSAPGKNRIAVQMGSPLQQLLCNSGRCMGQEAMQELPFVPLPHKHIRPWDGVSNPCLVSSHVCSPDANLGWGLFPPCQGSLKCGSNLRSGAAAGVCHPCLCGIAPHLSVLDEVDSLEVTRGLAFAAPHCAAACAQAERGKGAMRQSSHAIHAQTAEVAEGQVHSLCINYRHVSARFFEKLG